MKNRRLIIIVVVFTVVGSVVFLLRSRLGSRTAREDNSASTVAPFLPPVFPTPLSENQPSYNIQVPLKTSPSSVSLYENRPSFSVLPLAQAVAGRLAFTGEPKMLPSSGGARYVWTNNDSSLSIGGDPLEVSFASSGRAVTVVQANPQELLAIARGFLDKIGLSSPLLQLVAEPPLYFAPTKRELNLVEDSRRATLVQANYRYYLDGRPLYVRLPGVPGISLRINADKKIVSFTGYWFPLLAKKEGGVAVIPADEAARRLSRGEGSLLYFQSDADRNSEVRQQYEVARTTIDEALLGYYYAPGSPLFAPVYAFRGTGTDSETEKEVETTTLVSALPTRPPLPQ